MNFLQLTFLLDDNTRHSTPHGIRQQTVCIALNCSFLIVMEQLQQCSSYTQILYSIIKMVTDLHIRTALSQSQGYPLGGLFQNDTTVFLLILITYAHKNNRWKLAHNIEHWGELEQQLLKLKVELKLE